MGTIRPPAMRWGKIHVGCERESMRFLDVYVHEAAMDENYSDTFISFPQ